MTQQRIDRRERQKKVEKHWLIHALSFLMLPFYAACNGGFSGPAPDDNPGLSPYVSVSPENTGDGWPVSTPDAEGMDTQRLISGLESIKDGSYAGVDSVIIARNGRLVAEAYFNGYGSETLHDLRSASKSITSALVGIAVEQGAFSTEDTLANLIYRLDEYDNPDERKAAIRVIDLLNMESGLACDDWHLSSPGNEENMYQTRDWVSFVLDLPMNAEPGTTSDYCTGGVVLLGHIISTSTGMDLDVFADTYLFGPLGIQSVQWRRSPDGRPMGGGGMRLRPRDATRFGQLYLDNGVWGDERVMDVQWVEESKQRVTSLGQDGYGLLWWKRDFQVRGEMQEATFASGNGGNYIFLFPLENLVVVFTGSNYNSALGNQPFNILYLHILPAVN